MSMPGKRPSEQAMGTPEKQNQNTKRPTSEGGFVHVFPFVAIPCLAVGLFRSPPFVPGPCVLASFLHLSFTVSSGCHSEAGP